MIAFGGRALRPDEKAKYINSPETAIYKKSDTLYNLHRAKESIRKSDRVVLVEGYMDVIGVYAGGIHHVVASCGTALTEQQVRAMKRHSQHAVVNFDPDAAGANATERSIDMLLKESMHVRILTLNDGLDPDEYIKKHGAQIYTSQLDKATGYFIWLADRARKKHDMSSAEGRFEGFQAMLLPAIRRISDRLERAAVATEVADYLSIDRNVVLSEFRRAPVVREQTTAPVKTDQVPKTERILLRSLIYDAEVRQTLMPAIQVSNAARRFVIWPILEALIEMNEIGQEISVATIELRLSEPMQALLSLVLFADTNEEIFSLEQAVPYVRLLESGDRKLQVEFLRARLKEAEHNGDTSEAFRLIEELNGLQKLRKA